MLYFGDPDNGRRGEGRTGEEARAQLEFSLRECTWTWLESMTRSVASLSTSYLRLVRFAPIVSLGHVRPECHHDDRQMAYFYPSKKYSGFPRKKYVLGESRTPDLRISKHRDACRLIPVITGSLV